MSGGDPYLQTVLAQCGLHHVINQKGRGDGTYAARNGSDRSGCIYCCVKVHITTEPAVCKIYAHIYDHLLFGKAALVN